MKYKNLMSQEQFNEAKIEIIKKDDLDDNWTPEYHFSKDIKQAKKDFKKLGRKGLINKIISIVEKIGEKDYNEAVKLAKSKYLQYLPKYESIINTKYWKGSWGSMSKLLVILGSITESIEKSKESIAKEIAELKIRLKTIESIKENIDNDIIGKEFGWHGMDIKIIYIIDKESVVAEFPNGEENEIFIDDLIEQDPEVEIYLS